MKKTLIILVALSALVLAGCGEAGGYFNSDTKQLRNDKVGRLEAMGTDLRVYEFTPQSAPNKQCIFVAGDKKGGLTCFDKAPAATK